MNTSKIYLCGDVHGEMDIHKLKKHLFPEGKKLTKDDYVIALGDFGLLWDGGKRQENLIEWYESQKWTTLFIDGNHENHHQIANLLEVDLLGSKAGQVSDSIYHLKRGNVYTINDKTFFCMGGAHSIDKVYRTENVTWWKEEIPSHKEFENGLDSIEKYNKKFDYVLTHTCPSSILDEMVKLNRLYDLKVNDPVARYLQVVLEQIEFKHWYFGHFHLDINIKEKFNCLYENLIRLE